MASELPARVEPIDGAEVIDYPWAEAATALGSIDEAISTLGTQLEQRTAMVASIDDWVGTFRDEFNTTYGQLSTTASGLKDTLTTLASNIVGGAETANAAQMIRNNTERARRAQEAAEAARTAQPQPTP